MELEQLLSRIAEANDDEIGEIAKALIKRQKVLYPDWDPMYISFPIKQSEECERILRYLTQMLRKSMSNELVV